MARAKIKETEGTVNSVEYKKAEMSKAQNALKIAKSLNRPCRRASNSECEFSRQLNAPKPEKVSQEVLPNYMTVKQSAEYLGMTYGTFNDRQNKHKIPFVKINRLKYFLITDIEKYKIDYPIHFQHKEKRKYKNKVA